MSEQVRRDMAVARGADEPVHGGDPAWTPEAQLAALDRIERIEAGLTKIFGEVRVKHIDWNPEPWVPQRPKPEELDPDDV